MIPRPTPDFVSGILDRMEHQARLVRLAVLGAVALEALLMVAAILTLNWGDRTHVLLFIFAVLGYSIVALGLLALGAHVSRVGARVVAALGDHGDAG